MAKGFLPLDGVRVVDVTSSLAGPYCTEILGVMFYAANLNKRSLLFARLCGARSRRARNGRALRDESRSADHEQAGALGLIQPMPDPTVALPLSIDGERVIHRRPPPRLGEHADELLRHLGYDEDELGDLSGQSVIRRVESSS